MTEEELYEKYRRYMWTLANNTKIRYHVEESDVFSALCEALILAFRSYDNSKGDLHSRITYKLSMAIIQYLRDTDFLTKSDRKLFIQGEEIPLIRAAPLSPKSLYEQVFDGDDRVFLVDQVPDPTSEDEYLEADNRILVRSLLKICNEDAVKLIYVRHYTGLSMKNAGKLMGVSESRVCQIEGNIFKGKDNRRLAKGLSAAA